MDWAPAFHLFCFRYVEIEAFAVDLEPESGIIAEAMVERLHALGYRRIGLA